MSQIFVPPITHTTTKTTTTTKRTKTYFLTRNKQLPREQQNSNNPTQTAIISNTSVTLNPLLLDWESSGGGVGDGEYEGVLLE